MNPAPPRPAVGSCFRRNDEGRGWRLEGEGVVGGGWGDGDVEVLGELGEFRDYCLFVAGVAVDGDDVGEGQVLASGGLELVLED